MRSLRPRRIRLRGRPPWRWSRRQQLTVGPPLGLALVALAALLVFLLTAIASEDEGPTVPLPPELIGGAATPRPFRSPIVYPNPGGLTPAHVLRVIDGDTIEVDLSGRKETVRYYGVDSPERNQPCYQEAKAWNEAVLGEEVRLLADARDRDRFGRLLRYVFAPDGQSLDAALVAAGVGIAWREDGTYKDEIIAVEQSARGAEIGCLWRPPAKDKDD